MEKIKSSYEIAMEKAKKISEEEGDGGRGLEVREEIKPIMSRYFRGELDADGLWQELNEKDQEYLVQAQKLILESFGLRTSVDEFAKRKDGILALENLKSSPNSSVVEQILKKINELQKKYQNKRERMEEQFKEKMEQQTQLQMKSAETDGSSRGIQMGSSSNRQMQRQMKQQLSQLEEQSEQMFNSLINDLEKNI